MIFMPSRLRLAVLVSSAALVAGCSTSPFVAPVLSTGHANTAGAHQLFNEGTFEQLDLATLLDPENRRATMRTDTGDGGHTASGGGKDAVAFAAEAERKQMSAELERSFRAFYTYGPALEERRSRLQDRVLAASEQRCNTYKLYLKRLETAQNTTTGILTTILGGAGAIASHVTAAQAFAGLAGITSGIGAELRQNYFGNIASHVVTPGIDLARADLRREILSKRSSPMADYTVEAALVDAARYHAACSLNAGLERAGQAVRDVANPGLRNLNLTLAQLSLSQKLVRRLADDTVEITDKDLRFAEGVTAYGPALGRHGSSGGGSAKPDAWLDRYLRSLRDQASALATLNSEVDRTLRALPLAPSTVPGTSSAAVTPCQQCVAQVLLKELTAPARSTGSTISATIPELIAQIGAKPQDPYRNELATADGEIKALESALSDSQANGKDKAEKASALRKARAKIDGSYADADKQFALISDGIAAARGALSATVNTEALQAAISQVADAVGKLK